MKNIIEILKYYETGNSIKSDRELNKLLFRENNEEIESLVKELTDNKEIEKIKILIKNGLTITEEILEYTRLKNKRIFYLLNQEVNLFKTKKFRIRVSSGDYYDFIKSKKRKKDTLELYISKNGERAFMSLICLVDEINNSKYSNYLLIDDLNFILILKEYRFTLINNYLKLFISEYLTQDNIKENFHNWFFDCQKENIGKMKLNLKKIENLLKNNSTDFKDSNIIFIREDLKELIYQEFKLEFEEPIELREKIKDFFNDNIEEIEALIMDNVEVEYQDF